MTIESKIIEYQKVSNRNLLDEIIQNHSSLIKSLSGYYFRKNAKVFLYEDIKAVAIEGLIIAINKYNYEKNKIFEPYARLWIRAKIRQFLLKNLTPFSINDKAGRANFCNFYKTEKNNKEEYVSFLNAVYLTHATPDEENYMSSTISPEEDLLKKEKETLLNNEIIAFKDKITDIEKFILSERILSDSPLTLEAISEQFACTNQNIAYKEKKIVEKFKKHILNSKHRDVFQAGTLVA